MSVEAEADEVARPQRDVAIEAAQLGDVSDARIAPA